MDELNCWVHHMPNPGSLYTSKLIKSLHCTVCFHSSCGFSTLEVIHSSAHYCLHMKSFLIGWKCAKYSAATKGREATDPDPELFGYLAQMLFVLFGKRKLWHIWLPLPLFKPQAVFQALDTLTEHWHWRKLSGKVLCKMRKNVLRCK